MQRIYLLPHVEPIMESGIAFPEPEDDPTKIAEWLNYVDDIFETSDPNFNLLPLLRHVVCLAVKCPMPKDRCDAYMVLQQGLINHFQPDLSLLSVAEKLCVLKGKELLLALNVVGLSGDPQLIKYLIPFLMHADPYVRAEATGAEREIKLRR